MADTVNFLQNGYSGEVLEDLLPFIEAILRTFSACESLYVDAQGGIYAPGTHSAIRGNATLYKNPYYR
ncbi:MAG: hypothetical protein LBG15_00235 [Dysgonamonadaceae bacterium]|jgi:hypothetical protein|nr:hypothetical protein [Dysgonamonadaceae bacterium]